MASSNLYSNLSPRAALEASYKQALSDQQYAKEQIAPEFRRAANDLATQYERNRRNLNLQAMAAGLNTGTGSQQQLALNNSYMKNYANLQGQRATALSAADKAIADLKMQYQAALASLGGGGSSGGGGGGGYYTGNPNPTPGDYGDPNASKGGNEKSVANGNAAGYDYRGIPLSANVPSSSVSAQPTTTTTTALEKQPGFLPTLISTITSNLLHGR